jgi:hypothetical protein
MSNEKKIEEKNLQSGNRHAWLFLLETVFAISILILSSTVLVRGFVLSKRDRIQAEEMHGASISTENVTSIIRGSTSEEDLLTNLKKAYAVKAVKDKTKKKLVLYTTETGAKAKSNQKEKRYIITLQYEMDGSLFRGKLNCSLSNDPKDPTGSSALIKREILHEMGEGKL